MVVSQSGEILLVYGGSTNSNEFAGQQSQDKTIGWMALSMAMVNAPVGDSFKDLRLFPPMQTVLSVHLSPLTNLKCANLLKIKLREYSNRRNTGYYED